jgi:hypothetical protein
MPRTIVTSPMLKTLYTGDDVGVANTSPRNSRRGFCIAPEFTKPSPASRATWTATAGSAGITPPLAAIAMKFSSPPSMISGTPGTRRLAQTKPPSRA